MYVTAFNTSLLVGVAAQGQEAAALMQGVASQSGTLKMTVDLNGQVGELLEQETEA